MVILNCCAECSLGTTVLTARHHTPRPLPGLVRLPDQVATTAESGSQPASGAGTASELVAASPRDRPGVICTVARRSVTGSRASVIIVSYNARGALDRCLRSIRRASGSDSEIIVVDNGSSDGSATHVVESFPEVRLVRSLANQGFGAGCNLGARIARGEYLAFLNPDTVVEPRWLTELIGALAVNRQAGLATARILLLADPERLNTAGNSTHYTGLTLCQGMGQPRQNSATPREVGAVSGAAFVIHRHLFETLGGFDESFFLYMEDTDLSWRARLAGHASVYAPRSVVYHDYSLRFGPRKTFYQERNRYLLLLKTLRWRTLVVLAPALVLAEIVTWGFVLLHDRPHLANKLRAYAWIIQHRRQVLESRWRTQAQRASKDRDLLSHCDVQLAFEQTGAGWTASLAHRAFDPLFFVLHRLALGVIRW